MKSIMDISLKTNGYYIDMDSQVIYITKAFEEKANDFGSKEADLMFQMTEAFPNMRIEILRNKVSHKPITYDQMISFICAYPDAEKNVAEFMRVINISKIQRSPYKYVKNWFEANYPHYKDLVKFDENGEMYFEKKDAENDKQAAAKAQEVENAADADDQYEDDQEE